MKVFLNILVLICLLLSSCTSHVQEQTDQNDTTKQKDKLTKTKELISKDTVDYFLNRVKTFQDKYTGYSLAKADLIFPVINKEEHWLLQMIKQDQIRLSQDSSERSIEKLRRLPSPADYESIQGIRKADFNGSSGFEDISFENWSFANVNDAYTWFGILSDSLKGSQYTKPPRYQWVEGNDIFLISAKSAGHWFEFKDSLAVHMTGKTIAQLHNIYQPINLKHFKKWVGPSQGGPSQGGPSQGGPSQGGPSQGGPSQGASLHGNSTNQDSLFRFVSFLHYQYYYFVGQRLTGAARVQAQSEYPSKKEFSITTALHKLFTGNEQFNEMQESLVELQCAIEEENLGNFDLVNKSTDVLEPLFGKMIRQKEGFRIYGHDSRVIIVKVADQKIQSFTYRWLKNPFKSDKR